MPLQRTPEPAQSRTNKALSALHTIDRALFLAWRQLQVLPAFTPINAKAERDRLTKALQSDQPLRPNWQLRRPPDLTQVSRLLDTIRQQAPSLPLADLYLKRCEELDQDRELIQSIGHPVKVQEAARKRYGSGETLIPLAQHILANEAPDPEPQTIPARPLPGSPSLAGLILAEAKAHNFTISVDVRPDLLARAATGQNVVYIADALFGAREAQRLAIHEVQGHALAALNAQAQPLRLWQVGTPGSVEDQEGLALILEERAGFLVGTRLRTLAARAWAVSALHQGADFDQIVRVLQREIGCDPEAAIVIASRVFRGGGLAREAAYLTGWLRLRNLPSLALQAIASGRLSAAALAHIPKASDEALWIQPVYRPNLLLSFGNTVGGTSFETSPPKRAASLITWELT